MRSLTALFTGVLLVCVFAPARADDAYITTSFSDFVSQEPVHADQTPFKGWVYLTVTNTGSQPWGDFHFQIFDPMGGQDISNISFIDTPPYQPTSSQSPLSWTIDNLSVGARIDLFYYSDPVYPGDTATFSVYTDNPDHIPFFGVMLYPTPIPEPASLMLMACGALALVRSRR